MSDRNPFGAFLVGFLVGAVSAAVVVLLYAPQSGEETRTMIKDKSIELRDRAQQSAEAVVTEARSRADAVARQLRKHPEMEVKQPGNTIAA